MSPPTSSERCQRSFLEPLDGIFEAFQGTLGRVWGAFWGLREAFGGLLGPLGNGRAPLGVLLGFLGALGDFWGTSWGPLGGLLEASSGYLGGVFVVLGTSWDLCGGAFEPS